VRLCVESFFFLFDFVVVWTHLTMWNIRSSALLLAFPRAIFFACFVLLDVNEGDLKGIYGVDNVFPLFWFCLVFQVFVVGEEKSDERANKNPKNKK